MLFNHVATAITILFSMYHHYLAAETVPTTYMWPLPPTHQNGYMYENVSFDIEHHANIPYTIPASVTDLGGRFQMAPKASVLPMKMTTREKFPPNSEYWRIDMGIDINFMGNNPCGFFVVTIMPREMDISEFLGTMAGASIWHRFCRNSSSIMFGADWNQHGATNDPYDLVGIVDQCEECSNFFANAASDSITYEMIIQSADRDVTIVLSSNDTNDQVFPTVCFCHFRISLASMADEYDNLKLGVVIPDMTTTSFILNHVRVYGLSPYTGPDLVLKQPRTDLLPIPYDFWPGNWLSQISFDALSEINLPGQYSSCTMNIEINQDHSVTLGGITTDAHACLFAQINQVSSAAVGFRLEVDLFAGTLTNGGDGAGTDVMISLGDFNTMPLLSTYRQSGFFSNFEKLAFLITTRGHDETVDIRLFFSENVQATYNIVESPTCEGCHFSHLDLINGIVFIFQITSRDELTLSGYVKGEGTIGVCFQHFYVPGVMASLRSGDAAIRMETLNRNLNMAKFTFVSVNAYDLLGPAASSTESLITEAATSDPPEISSHQASTAAFQSTAVSTESVQSTIASTIAVQSTSLSTEFVQPTIASTIAVQSTEAPIVNSSSTAPFVSTEGPRSTEIYPTTVPSAESSSVLPTLDSNQASPSMGSQTESSTAAFTSGDQSVTRTVTPESNATTGNDTTTFRIDTVYFKYREIEKHPELRDPVTGYPIPLNTKGHGVPIVTLEDILKCPNLHPWVISPDDETRIDVYVTFTINKLLEIDDLAEKMSVIGTTYTQWTIKSCPAIDAVYKMERILVLRQEDVWKPLYTLDIGNEDLYMTSSDFGYDLQILYVPTWPNSTLFFYWTRTGIMNVTCSINVKKFPFDQQTCDFKFNLKEPNHFVKFGGIHLVAATQESPSNSWDLIEYSNYTVNTPSSTIHSEAASQAFARLTFNRKPYYYMHSLLTPCILLTTAMITIFISPTKASERATATSLVLLSFRFLQSEAADMVPVTVERVLLVDYIMHMYVIAGLLTLYHFVINIASVLKMSVIFNIPYFGIKRSIKVQRLIDIGVLIFALLWLFIENMVLAGS